MKKIAVVFVLAYGMAFSLAPHAQQAPSDGPQYTGTALVRPTDYREWVFQFYPTLLEVARRMGTLKPGF